MSGSIAQPIRAYGSARIWTEAWAVWNVSHSMPAAERPIDEALAAALKRLRDDREVTQEELAWHARLTTNGYAKVERGKSDPAWSTVRKIADGLGVSLTELAEAVEREEG